MFDQKQHQLGFSPFTLITLASHRDVVIVKSDRSNFFDKIYDLEIIADNSGFTIKKFDTVKEYQYNVPLNYKDDVLLIEWLKSYNLENNVQTFSFS